MDINELNELTVVRLKELCIANGIRGASKLNKPDLIKILNEFYKTTSKQKLKAKKSPTIRRKSIDSNISPSIRSSSKSSVKSPKKSKFLEQYVNICKEGKIKSLDTNICVPMDGPKGRKAVEKLEKSCDSKGGVFNNKTLNCHASDLVSDEDSDIASQIASTISIVPKSKKTLPRGSPVSSEASTISIVPKSKKTLPRGSPVQSIISSSTITKPCEQGKIRTLDKGNRCVSVNLKRGKETIAKLQELCSNKGEGYIFNDTTYKCDKVSKPDIAPSIIEIPKPLVSDKFVWSPSESEGTVTPVLRSPFEQVLRSPFETTMKLPAQIPSPSSSISTIIYPTESELEQFNRIKRSLVGLVVSEDVDILKIIGIDENGIETEYILNRDDIVISDELENMENLVMFIYHLSRKVERPFPESKVIKTLPRNIRILELQNNMMIDLTIPNDIRNVEQLKFVNFYVFEGMTLQIAIPQKTKFEYVNLIRKSETDLAEYGYYILR